MQVIHADHERRYDIPGVPGPARRPVDIDASLTGFKRLRSLRVYRFSPGAPVDGHAEEDEVFVILTSGAAEIEIGWEDTSQNSVGTFALSGFAESGAGSCVAYLPPLSVYRLTPHTEVDVAYARATPTRDLEPRIFRIEAEAGAAGATTLLSEQAHAQHLRLRLSQVASSEQPAPIDLRESSDATSESLVHFQSAARGAIATLSSTADEQLTLRSWDTVALAPSETATLHVQSGTALAILTVSAE